MVGAIAAMFVACCGAQGQAGHWPTIHAAAGTTPGGDTAPQPSTQAPSASYGAPGGDTGSASTTPGPGTMTGTPGGNSSPAGESPGGSTTPSNTSR